MKTSRRIQSFKAAPWFLVVFLILFISGCPLQVPIREATTQVNPGDLQFKATQISLLIQSGATAAGWNIVGTRPGEILVEYTFKGNRVVVAILYAKNQYEIIHRESSPGLKYDSQKQFIHKNYNDWVDQLDRVIQTEITRYFAAQMTELSSKPPETPQPVEQPDGGPPASTDETAEPQTNDPQPSTEPPAPPAAENQ